MRSHTLMLVDDEEHILNSLKRLLQNEPYSVITAPSGEKALEVLKTTPVDIIISDYRMPGMSGLDFLKKVKEYYPDIIRMILTGYADLEATIGAINEGEVFRFITKPWDNDEFKIVIHNAVAHYDLMMDNRILLAMVKQQGSLISSIEKDYPGITTLPKAKDGVYILEDNDLPADVSLEEFISKYFTSSNSDDE